MKLNKEFIDQWSKAVVDAAAAFETGNVTHVSDGFIIYKAISTTYTGMNVFYRGKQLCTLDDVSIPTAAGALNYKYTLGELLLARLNRSIVKQAAAIVSSVFDKLTTVKDFDGESKLFGLSLTTSGSEKPHTGITLVRVKKGDEIVGLYQSLTDDDMKFIMDDISEIAIHSVADRIRAGELDFEI